MKLLFLLPVLSVVIGIGSHMSWTRGRGDASAVILFHLIASVALTVFAFWILGPEDKSAGSWHLVGAIKSVLTIGMIIAFLVSSAIGLWLESNERQ